LFCSINKALFCSLAIILFVLVYSCICVFLFHKETAFNAFVSQVKFVFKFTFDISQIHKALDILFIQDIALLIKSFKTQLALFNHFQINQGIFQKAIHIFSHNVEKIVHTLLAKSVNSVILFLTNIHTFTQKSFSIQIQLLKVPCIAVKTLQKKVDNL
jgi:hypothetical protein